MKLEEEAGMHETVVKAGSDTNLSSQAPVSDPYLALKDIEKKIASCHECELYKTRRNFVFGDGNAKALLMFIGEAPGLEEDIQGKPFVGKAGQLLTKIIEAMGMKREDVYIANALKCRPPKNRTPLPSEIAACRNYLLSQIDLIKPKLICCLGRPATQALLMTDSAISKIRGNFYDFNGIAVMPTFHPAYLLRNPADKKLAWKDFKKVRDFLSNPK